MGKSQVPRGATKKRRCKCGAYYYPVLIGNSMKLTQECPICKPEQYQQKKK